MQSNSNPTGSFFPPEKNQDIVINGPKNIVIQHHEMQRLANFLKETLNKILSNLKDKSDTKEPLNSIFPKCSIIYLIENKDIGNNITSSFLEIICLNETKRMMPIFELLHGRLNRSLSEASLVKSKYKITLTVSRISPLQSFDLLKKDLLEDLKDYLPEKVHPEAYTKTEIDDLLNAFLSKNI